MKVHLTTAFLSTLVALSSAQNRLPPNQAPSIYRRPEIDNQHTQPQPQPHIFDTKSSPRTTHDVTIHYISHLNPFFPNQWRRQNPSTWTVKMHSSSDSAGDFSGFAFLEDETVFRRAWIEDGPENVKCYIGGLVSPDGSNMFDANKPFKGNVKSRMLKCNLKGRGLRKIREVDDERMLHGASSVDRNGNLLKAPSQIELPEAPVNENRRKSRWW